MATVSEVAAKVLRESMDPEGNGHPIVLGIPRDLDDIEGPSATDDRTAPVRSHCTECSEPVWSTELKTAIMDLEPKTRLLCPTCLAKFMLKNGPPDSIEVKKLERPTDG